MKDTANEGTHLDAVRRHNLAGVLRIVHREGSLSRSALTKATGLNRSTVGGIVAELVDNGLVLEQDPAMSNRVGRPSPIVVPEPNVVAFAVNPEIDAITVAVVGLNATVRDRIRFPLPAVPSAGAAVTYITEVIEQLRSRLPAAVRIVGVGVAVPGLVREGDGVVRLAPHLGWREEPFSQHLNEALGYPVSAANDANLGANAEHIFGAGRGANNLVYLNGGASGIGGGVIVEGAPLTGVSGYAGEFGHTLVNSSGRACHCGAIGCLETEVSQERLYATLAGGGDPEEREASLVSALEAGDPVVTAEVERQSEFLAVALRSATNLFNPDRIILGGFLGLLHETNPLRLPQLVQRHSLAASAETLTINRAVLGRDILMIGAAELAFSALLEDPLGLF